MKESFALCVLYWVSEHFSWVFQLHCWVTLIDSRISGSVRLEGKVKFRPD